MGVTIELTSLPAKRAAIELLETSDTPFHGDIGRSMSYILQAQDALIPVKEPIFSIPLWVYSKSAEIKINGWESLKAYRAVTVRGFAVYAKYLKGAKTSEVSSIHQAFLFLNADRADFFVIDAIRAQAVLMLPEFKNSNIKPLAPAIGNEPLYTVFLKKYAYLEPPYTRALIAMKKDGSYDKIIKSIK